MHSKLTFYKSAFITNATVFVLLICLVAYNIFFKRNTPLNNDDAIGFSALAFFVAIYLTNDLAGLMLIKKLRNNDSISKGRIIGTIIILCLIGILQILLAIGLYTGLKNIFKFYKDPFFIKIYLNILIIYILLIIIFVTAIYNFISTIRLIKMTKSNQNEFERQIEEIGSGY